MTRIILLCCVLFFTPWISKGQGIRFFKGTYEEALAEAKKQNKLLFVDTYADWCGPCKYMAETVFTLKTAGDYFNEHFVCYQLNIDLQENKPFVTAQQVKSVPILYFIDGNGKIVKKYPGAVNLAMLLHLGQEMLNKQKTPGQLYRACQEDAGDLVSRQALLLDYSRFMWQLEGEEKQMWEDRMNILFPEYCKRKELKNMINETDFLIISQFHKKAEKADPFMNFMVKHWNDYKQVMDSSLLAGYLLDIHEAYLHELARSGDPDYRKEVKRILGDMQPMYQKGIPAEMMYAGLKRVLDMEYAIYFKKDIALYTREVEDYFKAYNVAFAADYLKFTEMMFEGLGNRPTEAAYKQGLKWLETKSKTDEMEDPKTWINIELLRGDCYRGLHNYEKALACYKQADVLIPAIKKEEIAKPFKEKVLKKLDELESTRAK